MNRFVPLANTLIAVAITSPALADADGEVAGAYEPTSHYEVKNVEGWQVYVHRDLLPGGGEREAGEPALRQLRYGLAKTKQMVADTPLEKLQQVKVWLEVDTTNGPHGRTPAYHYHPGLGWLKKMDYHPDKHKCVEFGKAEGLAKRSDFKSVQVTMHELAHAYHDQVLGFDDPDVLAAHKRAREEGKYPEGDWVVRANHKEFFAGLTTRYFETEERRKEIVERDPIFAKKLEEYWGSPKALMHDPLPDSAVGTPETSTAVAELPVKIYFMAGQSNIKEANHIIPAGEDVPLTLGGLIDREGQFQVFDELAIWQRAITPEEVATLYNNGFGAEITSGNVTE